MGSLVVGYTVCGAFIFQAIEDTEESSDLIKEVGCRLNCNWIILLCVKVTEKRNTTLLELWNIANTYNTLNPRLGIS